MSVEWGEEGSEEEGEGLGKSVQGWGSHHGASTLYLYAV